MWFHRDQWKGKETMSLIFSSLYIKTQKYTIQFHTISKTIQFLNTKEEFT